MVYIKHNKAVFEEKGGGRTFCKDLTFSAETLVALFGIKQISVRKIKGGKILKIRQSTQGFTLYGRRNKYGLATGYACDTYLRTAFGYIPSVLYYR